MTPGNVDNIPEMAAYFGDPDGDVTLYSVAVDDYGYIYLSGNSLAPAASF